VEQHVQETDSSVTEKVNVPDKHATMKKVYMELKQSYSSLKEMTKQQPQQLNFVDPRVRELWTLAQRANMTEDILSSIKVSRSYNRTCAGLNSGVFRLLEVTLNYLK